MSDGDWQRVKALDLRKGDRLREKEKPGVEVLEAHLDADTMVAVRLSDGGFALFEIERLVEVYRT